MLLFFLGQSFLLSFFGSGSNLALLVSGIDKHSAEETVLAYYRSTILENKDVLQDPTTYAVHLTFTDINVDGQDDIVATIDSKDTCGSGGCITTIFLQNESRQFEALNFMYATKTIKVLDGITRGMHDIELNGDKSNRLSWDGNSYSLVQL